MDEAWTKFVLAHTSPLNVALHLVSAAMYVGCPLLAVLLGQPWWLLGFFGSGLVAAAGHLLSREGADGLTLTRVAFSLQVVTDVLSMALLVLRGRWGAEIARARSAAA